MKKRKTKKQFNTTLDTFFMEISSNDFKNESPMLLNVDYDTAVEVITDLIATHNRAGSKGFSVYINPSIMMLVD